MKIRNKIILAITIASFFVNLFFGFYLVNKKRNAETERLDQKIETTNQLLKYTNTSLVWDIDKKKIIENLESFQKDPEILGIHLVDTTGVIDVIAGKFDLNDQSSTKTIKRSFLLEKNKSVLGEITVIYTNAIMRENIKDIIIEMALVTLGLLTINIFVIFFISKYLLKPTEEIVSGLKKVDGGSYDFTLNLNTKDEFSIIEGYFNKMVRTIKRDIDYREESKKKLQQNNQQLKIEIEEREKIELALQKSEELYRLIADNATDIISQLTPDGIYLYVSSACRYLLGYEPEELVSSNSYFLIYKDDFDKIQKSHSKVKQINDIDTVSYRIRHKNGKYIWFESTNKALIDPETGKTKITCVSRNISERKKYEEELKMAKQKAEESDLLKSAFLANMSHEIRTPMNGILGFSELLKLPNIDDEKKNKYIEIINKSSHTLLNIINDIMDISKIEANQLKITEAECNINNMIDDLHDFYIPFKNNKDNKNKSQVAIQIKKGLNDDKCRIYTDLERVNQILSNLISNAIKFTQKGFIEIGYNIIVEAEKTTIRFFVSDTGIGIPNEKQSIIFERFRQADDSLTRQYGGTGLGLPISKGLAKLLGGDIWVESDDKGSGSTFYLTIPYKPVITSNIKEFAKETSNSKYYWKEKNILVVEDDITSFIFIEEILNDTKTNIIHAENGKQAVDICKTNPAIHIILMDMQMPILNGYDATKQIKQIKQNIPIIAQTANAMVDDKAKCIEAGCIDYLAKPIDAQLLLETINKYII